MLTETEDQTSRNRIWLPTGTESFAARCPPGALWERRAAAASRRGVTGPLTRARSGACDRECDERHQRTCDAGNRASNSQLGHP